MKELTDELADYLGTAKYEDTPSCEMADAVIDIVRDANWLPPDEVRNESADLQLAATALVKALDGRLVTDSYPPLGPLVERLAKELLPYQAVEGGPVVAGGRVVAEVDAARMLELLRGRANSVRPEMQNGVAQWVGMVHAGSQLLWSRRSPSYHTVISDLMAWLEAGG